MRTFYTDGSFGGKSINAGGWAILEVVDGQIAFEKWDADFSIDVTSNKVEMKAAIEALKMINPGESATIYSDSQHVVKGMSEWILGWQKNNWETSKQEPVKNKELWLEMLSQAKGKDIKWVWVRSHFIDAYNNRVDELAKLAYLAPEEIVVVQSKSKKEDLLKPEVGSIIYFEDQSKRYIVMLNDVNVGKSRGFLAKLLANNLGNELEFFEYNLKINTIKDKSDKESRMVFKTIEQFKNNIKQAFETIKEACNHRIKNLGDRAYCPSCETFFGWYCPKSKDKCCHYFSENGKVELETGEFVDIPNVHDPDYETYDSCIFCGEPDERK